MYTHTHPIWGNLEYWHPSLNSKYAWFKRAEGVYIALLIEECEVISLNPTIRLLQPIPTYSGTY